MKLTLILKVPVLDQIPSLPYLKNLNLSGIIPNLYGMRSGEQEQYVTTACYCEKEGMLKEMILGYKRAVFKVFEGPVINKEKHYVFEFLEGAQSFMCAFGVEHFVRTQMHFG